MDRNYLFTSQRLGFRNWRTEDIPFLAAINADPAVMEFFPGTKSLIETTDFIGRMQRQYTAKGYCYFAVDVLADNQFIGFIGISKQTFISPYTPCHDVGWRLAQNSWGSGYATEGAKACIAYAFDKLLLAKLIAIAPAINTRSVQVMGKAGMMRAGEFVHPLLLTDERLKNCVVYEILSNNHQL